MPKSKPVGIRIERKKDASLLNWNLKRPPSPEKVRVLLRPGSVSCVHNGDQVRIGQKIADPGNPEEVTVHASITGVVTGMTMVPGGESVMVEIQRSGEPKLASGVLEIRKEWEQVSADELLKIFQHAGLVTTDAATEPVHAKIKKHVIARTVIVNGCEPEPYITCEQALLMSHPVEILRGAELLRKALGAEKILFAFEDCNFEGSELLKSKIFFLRWNHAGVRSVPTLYPQGLESTLLQNWFPGKEDQAVVFPASTAFAVYEAIVHQKPFYERVVTVGGECVVEPRSLWLPLGTPLQDAFHICKGMMREPDKVLVGGPMAGTVQTRLNVPVTAGTTALLALPREITKEEPEEPCIRCNSCVDRCPVGISPALITLAAEHREYEIAESLGVQACIECGNCGYVCPSKRAMLERIRLARSHSRIFSSAQTMVHHG